MKIIWAFIIISGTHQAMIRITRPARPALTRGYGSRTTFSMKITNPKLIASLEAARLKSQKGPLTPEPEVSQRGTCDAITREHPIQRGYAPQSPYAHRHTPSSMAIAGGLGQAVAHEAESFLQYKLCQKADEILCNGGHQIQTSMSHPARENTNDDSDED